MRVNGMPTPRGSLSYSLRRLDGDTVRFGIDGGVAGKIILRPPLAAPLRAVTLDGASHEHFDADSVTILQTPAQVTCSTAS